VRSSPDLAADWNEPRFPVKQCLNDPRGLVATPWHTQRGLPVGAGKDKMCNLLRHTQKRGGDRRTDFAVSMDRYPH